MAREYKGGIKAVDGIDLRIEPGEIYGFLGPNGAGKSTTVHMLTTLLPPTSGTARVAGYDIVKQGPQVRASIGAALQEAALDPFLTGREHLRLQASLHGLSPDERKRRSTELLERVGLTRAADRKIKGYSGGMKRRLDLALALVHEPSTLFLDEPTTGLDPQSRTALWSEVARLAKAEGVTVFLTTQYLEEADVLADRVGIIHRGHIVAEGTPDELKASIGRPTVEVTPADPDQHEAIEELLRNFGSPTAGDPLTVAVRCEQEADLADIIRALDAAGLHVAQIQMTSRRSTTSFSPRRAPRSRAPPKRKRRREKRKRSSSRSTRDELGSPGPRDRAALHRAHAAPARADHPQRHLPAPPAGDQLERPAGGDAHPGLPDQLVPRLLHPDRVHAGRALRLGNRRRGSRPRHRQRLPQPSRAHASARVGTPARSARRGGGARGDPGHRVPGRRDRGRRSVRVGSGRRRPPVRARHSDRARVRDARNPDRAQTGSGEAVQSRLPSPLLPALPIVDEPAAQPDRRRLVPGSGDRQPGLVHDRGDAQPGDHGLGRTGARARLPVHDPDDRGRPLRVGQAAQTRMART